MDILDSKKVSFIICVNNTEVFNECEYYLNQLALPDGIKKDIITVYDAVSMAAGYNAAMYSSDAKYKIYLHQDVFIINRNFIEDVIKIFTSDQSIGLLGCIGSTNIGKAAMAVTSWDTGKVIHHCGKKILELGENKHNFSEVMALDGLLLATQYDIPWREDIMDGWDFYDIAQCMEFARAGYKAVVPKQESAWCYHDNKSSNMSKYHYYRKRFIAEYQSDENFEELDTINDELDLEYEKIKQQMTEIILQLINSEAREQMYEIFQNPQQRQYIHIAEFGMIADTDYLESRNKADKRLWDKGMNARELFQKIRKLKYWIIRIENHASDVTCIMDQVLSEYSIYAVSIVYTQYVANKEYVFHAIKKYLEQKRLSEELAIWESLEQY